jgi:hypothetical protein
MKLLFWKKPNKDAEVLRGAMTDAFVNAAYSKRAKEIESLRKYDQGEKQIIAPDIRTIVRGI